MENDASPSLSPLPPSFVPDIVYSGTLTPLAPTYSASCYTDSFADLEIAALVKENEAIESLEKALEDNREELGSQKQRFLDWNVFSTNRSSIMNRNSNQSLNTPGRNVLMNAIFVTSRTRSLTYANKLFF